MLNSVFTIEVQVFFPGSQIEIDTVTKTGETEEWWQSGYDDRSESWEEEVEDLVAWTSTLDTDTLEY